MDSNRNSVSQQADLQPDNQQHHSIGSLRGSSFHQVMSSAAYSPLGAADSGYHADSPLMSSLDTAAAGPSFEAAARPPSSTGATRYQVTPPPGTFRPVSPQPSLLPEPAVHRPQSSSSSGGGGGISGVRHAATQTFQPVLSLLHQQPEQLDHSQRRPFESQRSQVPQYHSQQSTGFRPASAPLHDMLDGGGGGGDLDNDDAELEEDFDEEVYRSSAAVGGGGALHHPLPDLVQLQRHRSRSVPVTDERARQERVAVLLREIGDQYNLSRGASPVSLFQAPWMLGSGRQRNRDRRISLRFEETPEEAGGASGSGGGANWGGGIMGWMARMVRNLSGAEIAQEDELEEEEEQQAAGGGGGR